MSTAATSMSGANGAKYLVSQPDQLPQHNHTVSMGDVAFTAEGMTRSAPTQSDTERLKTFAKLHESAPTLTASSLRRVIPPPTTSRSVSVMELPKHGGPYLPPLTVTPAAPSATQGQNQRTVSFYLTDVSPITPKTGSPSVSPPSTRTHANLVTNSGAFTFRATSRAKPAPHGEVDVPSVVTIRSDVLSPSGEHPSLSLVPLPMILAGSSTGQVATNPGNTSTTSTHDDSVSSSAVNSPLQILSGTSTAHSVHVPPHSTVNVAVHLAPPANQANRPALPPGAHPPLYPLPPIKTFQPMDRCIIDRLESLEEIDGCGKVLATPVACVGRVVNESVSIVGNTLGAVISTCGAIVYVAGSATAFLPTISTSGGCREENQELAKGRLLIAWDLTKTTGISLVCITKKVLGVGVLNYFGTRWCPEYTRDITKTVYRGIGDCLSRSQSREFRGKPSTSKLMIQDFRKSWFKQSLLSVSGAGSFAKDTIAIQHRRDQSMPQGSLPHLPSSDAVVLTQPTATALSTTAI